MAEVVATAVAVAVALELALEVGEADLIEALGAGEVDAEAEPEGLALTQKDTVGAGPRMVWLTLPAPLPPPFSSSAIGTTRIPRRTVATKASAPHSWRQNVRDELRIRVLRPAPAAACCAY